MEDIARYNELVNGVHKPTYKLVGHHPVYPPYNIEDNGKYIMDRWQIMVMII